MNRLVALALAALTGNAFAHEFVVGNREIPHVHFSPELLLLIALVATLAVLRSK